MAVKKTYEEYRKIFEECQSDNYINVKDNLESLKYTEISYKVVLYLCVVAIIVMIVFLTESAGAIILIFPIAIFGGALGLPMYTKILKLKLKLDDELFNKFLINKLKIFYSVNELADYTYTKMEHLTSSDTSTLKNQPVINITYLAYKKGAEGVIVTDQNSSTITTGSYDKRGGTVSSHIVNSAEGILIKDIEKKKINIDLEETINQNTKSTSKDLNYWFGLKEKGAISEEEYQKKKDELLSK